MDGRIQEPIINYIKRKYEVKYIDTITEPGPNKIVAQNSDNPLIESIDNRIAISLNKHGSKIIFISGHHDCAGNPVPKETQLEQLGKNEKLLKLKYPKIKIVKLWINENWEVNEF